MSPSQLSAAVVTDRVAWIDAMLDGIRRLDLDAGEPFRAESPEAAAAESYLRRGLELLLDLGRHVLAKGFGEAAPEYKAIASGLEKRRVLDEAESTLLRTLAGYRNRMVHFYHELSADELHEICVRQLGDLEAVLDGLQRWIHENPDRIDRAL
jgi:uncharacterized protein YutE (UPF0331/DUF86 family)